MFIDINLQLLWLVSYLDVLCFGKLRIGHCATMSWCDDFLNGVSQQGT
jgi:hypothetical protein